VEEGGTLIVFPSWLCGSVVDSNLNAAGLYDQCNPRFWPFCVESRIATVVDGSCLRFDRSLPGWAGLESAASPLACGRGKLQDLVKGLILRVEIELIASNQKGCLIAAARCVDLALLNQWNES